MNNGQTGDVKYLGYLRVIKKKTKLEGVIQIDDKIISLEIFEKRFVCDLGACKGDCCVEGESGAPIDDKEAKILEDLYPKIKSYLTPKAIEVIEKQGAWVVDFENEKVTPIIEGAECVYAYYEDATCKCAIEKAYREGVIDFMKPISCHLYPIRAQKYPKFEALNYHLWGICNKARVLGNKLGVPVFKFLKEPLIRKYGEAFYEEMEVVEKELKKQGVIK